MPAGSVEVPLESNISRDGIVPENNRVELSLELELSSFVRVSEISVKQSVVQLVSALGGIVGGLVAAYSAAFRCVGAGGKKCSRSRGRCGGMCGCVAPLLNDPQKPVEAASWSAFTVNPMHPDAVLKPRGAVREAGVASPS